jgi:hypothetical protein
MIGSDFFIGPRASDWILKILKILSNQRGRGHDAAIWAECVEKLYFKFRTHQKAKTTTQQKTKLTPAPNQS